jgi:hypothetical protein
MPSTEVKIPLFWIILQGNYCFAEEFFNRPSKTKDLDENREDQRTMWSRRNRLDEDRVKADFTAEQAPAGHSPPAPIESEHVGANHAIALQAAAAGPEAPAGAWRMALVVTASALCGGIAVVLWNRRLLTRIREVAPPARSSRQGRLWEDDV